MMSRWSASIKEEIKRSRVDTTNRVARAINACDEATRPRVLINSSAIGNHSEMCGLPYSPVLATPQPHKDWLSMLQNGAAVV